MNQKLLARLVAGLFGGVALVGAAQAGQIQASSVTIAREVITDNDQAITAPSAAYRFSGDVVATSQNQTFQVQLTLGAGTFSTLPGGIEQAFSITDGSSGRIQAQVTSGSFTSLGNLLGAVAAANGTASNAQAVYTVDTVDLSADKKTIYATFTVYQSPTATILQPIIGFNAGVNNLVTVTAGPVYDVATVSAIAITNRASIQDLFSVVGDIPGDYTSQGICQDVKRLPVEFKHFVGLTQPTQLATPDNAQADEHVRAASTNSGDLITFPTNLLVRFTKSAGNAKLNASATGFSGSAVASPPDFDSYISGTLLNLGALTLVQNGTGYDSDLTNQYLLNNSAVTPAGVKGRTPATASNGQVEVNRVDLRVSATEGFVVGGTLHLSTTADCGTTISGSTTTAFTSSTAAGPVTVPIVTAQVNTAFGANGTASVYICYSVPGTTAVIPTSAFSVVGTVVKGANGATFLGEQNNVCGGPLYALAGGIKIDVRNYANSKKDAGGWYSVIRLINTSETGTATVYGQIIEPDGKFGPWGQITTLAPRAVVNLTSEQIDVKLVNAPDSSADGHDSPQGYDASGAPRLRITAEGTDSLRVQNYMVNPATGAIDEFSSAQGVDFGGGADRAPVNEGQYHSQDARTGLNGQ
jgi:hypothetical protein